MLTITCPFSNKPECIDLVLSSMDSLLIPDNPVKWVFLDNSKNIFIETKLQNFLERKKLSGHLVSYIKSDKQYTYGTIDVLYNDLKEHVVGNWLSLEDDVVNYPRDLVQEMYRVLYDNYEIAIVAASMEQRRFFPGPMAWKTEVNDGKIGLRPIPPRLEPYTLVDAVHTGCTLIRPSVHSGYTFRQNGSNKNIIGHDIHLCLDAKEKGLRTAVLWNTKAGHYTEDRGVIYPKSLETYTPMELRIKKPLVSVITPTCSRPTYLKRLIENLQAQVYQNFEHLICNDGPCTDTSKLVDSFEDHRLRYYELGFKHSFSGSPQRNKMLAKAGGDLVVFLDDDVEISNDYLLTMVNMWKAGNILGVVQIEVVEGDTTRIIPEHKTQAIQPGFIDTMSFFVDTSIAKGFFWDLFDEHDARYFASVASFARYAFGFTERVLGKNKRNYGKPEIIDTVKTPKEIVRELSRSLSSATAEAEDIILSDAQATLSYIVNVLGNKPWEKAEPILATDRNISLFYIRNVLKGQRFVLCEELMSRDIYSALAYTQCTGLQWGDLGYIDIDKEFLKNKNLLKDYLRFLKKEWPEGKSVLNS